MTRKDYKIIADAILRAYLWEAKKGAEQEGVKRVAQELSMSLYQNNHRFNRLKFMQACGLPENNK